ncbi:NitT/TauT family transport system substrate-binding protein [Variovorax sp. YR216]|nr:NitT/TauT family transport system substrate-binding protein [Variovorax sp. YR216]
MRVRSSAKLLLVASAWLIACCLPEQAGAEVLRLVVGGIDKQIYLPAVLAQRLGYFSEQGLEVELQNDTSGVRAEDKLLAGAVQGVVGFYDHTIVLQAKGKFVRSVVQFSRAPGEALVSSSKLPPLGSPAALAGRTLGVAGLGSSTQLLTQYFGLINGVKISQMNFITFESSSAFVEGMRHGRIDAGMTTEPAISSLVAAGQAHLMIDLRTPASSVAAIGGNYPGACLYLSALWIDTHRDQTQRLVNAFVKALRYIDAHSAEEIAALLPASVVGADRKIYVSALAASKSMFISDGVMPPDGPPTVLKVLNVTSQSVRGKAVDLARTYTNDYVTGVR